MVDLIQLRFSMFETILVAGQASKRRTRVGVLSLEAIVNCIISRLTFIGVLPNLNGEVKNYSREEVLVCVLQAIAEGEAAVNRRIDTDMTGYVAICRDLAEMMLETRIENSSGAEHLDKAACS